MQKLIFILVIVFTLQGYAQDSLYDKDFPIASFHSARRQALRDKMAPNSVAFVFANPVRNRNNDVDFKYAQNPDFFYLSGLIEPDAVLVVFKETQLFDSVSTNELIFVQPRNPGAESWTGKRLGTEGVKSKLGIKNAFDNARFRDFKFDFSSIQKIYHSWFYDDVRDDSYDSGDLYSLIYHFRDKTKDAKDKIDLYGLYNRMAELRESKTPEEIALLRKAVNITCDAHADMIRSIEPNMKEYQAQALVEFGFTFNGSEYTGYPSIVGAGENSCILHYVSNRKSFQNKDLLVVDAGAEYHGYTADVTRTVPVDGTFSEEQKTIYNIVLEAQNQGIKACKKGNAFRDPHNAAVEVIKAGLKKNGIIKNESEFQKYFFHGTSHYLGLDVHDPGTYQRLKPGQVITVEPGIYIPEGSPCDKKWWNIGVRIEDDILITESEPDVLSGKLPKTVTEIEKLMAEPGILKKN
jgi:Xaa-Pro aminopeptidase